MSMGSQRRTAAYKEILRRRINALKGSEYLGKLDRLTKKDLGRLAVDFAPGVSFSNVARDVRALTTAGTGYDAEFDLLWRGQAIPQIIDRYSERFLAELIQGVVVPRDLDRRIRDIPRQRILPGGRKVWEEI